MNQVWRHNKDLEITFEDGNTIKFHELSIKNIKEGEGLGLIMNENGYDLTIANTNLDCFTSSLGIFPLCPCQ